MERFHPLAADADAPAEEVAAAQAACALALGRLDGLLAGLTAAETTLVGWGLLRRVLQTALAQAGFADADARFDAWCAGLDRGPDATPGTQCAAHTIVRALLAALSHHRWAPLAAAAQTVVQVGRFAADRPPQAEDLRAGEAVARAAALVEHARGPHDTPLPFAALARLHDLLCADPRFAPVERGTRLLPLAERTLALDQPGPRPPLWAVDAVLGQLLTTSGSWRIALPCPGAITAEALQPQLWPGERAIVVAHSLAASAVRLADLIAAARRQAALMHAHLAHLRSGARAPQVWMATVAFAPLGLGQIAAAFGVSRRGTYAISDALVAVGLARRVTVKGRILLTGETPHSRLEAVPPPPASPLPTPALAEFDAALADIDRLLARHAETDV